MNNNNNNIVAFGPFHHRLLKKGVKFVILLVDWDGEFTGRSVICLVYKHFNMHFPDISSLCFGLNNFLSS